MAMMKSIRARLVLWIGVVLAFGVATFAVAFYNQTVLWIREDLVEKLDNRVIAFAFSVNPLDPVYEARFDRGFRPEVSGTFFMLYDTNGVLIGKSTGVTEIFGLSEGARKQTHPFLHPFREEGHLPGGTPFRAATYPVFVRDDLPHRSSKPDEPAQLTVSDRRISAWAQVGATTAGLHDRMFRLRLWLALAAGALFITAMTAVYFLAGQWLRSLRTAAETAETLSGKEIARMRLVAPSDEPEIGRLAAAFNRLLDRLSEAHTTQQRLVADASHELRTPLTILRGEIQVALRKDRSPERYRAVLASNGEEIIRLCRIVENLLALAHADAGEALARKDPVDVAALAAEVCAKFTPFAEASQVTLRCEATERCLVIGDSFALQSVLTNLVENAVRHSPPEEEVLVIVATDERHVKIEVIDHGVGIAREHLPRLFERFYRVDKSRSRQFGGAGLGLAIVKTMLEAHNGTVTVSSEVGVGSTFTVRLPHLNLNAV